MRRIVLDFLRRGLCAWGFGPIVLAIIYLILQKNIGIQTVTIHEICLGIFTSAILAFIAGGTPVIYQIEKLPLMVAILIHGAVLYAAYLVVYLVNGWLEWGDSSMLVFTIIFVLGYFAIWAVIYAVTKKRTRKLNEILNKNRMET